MKLALDHVRNHERQPLTVGDLCEVTKSSERSLQYLFKDHFQVSPKQYLLAQRLDGVRRGLRGASDRQIGEVAGEWVFAHLGQFAAKYREVFGELPSQTRQRYREVRGVLPGGL